MNSAIKKDDINVIVISAMLLLSFATLFQSSLTIPGLIVDFVLAVYLYIMNMGRHIKLPFFICLTATAASLVITNLTHSALGSTFIILNVVLLCSLVNNVKIPDNYCKKIRTIVSILLFVYIITCNNARLVYRTTTTDYFGNVVNGNHLGILALIIFFNISIILSESNLKKTKYLIHITITLLCAYYLALTGCRTAIISMVAYFFLSLFKRTPFSNKSFRRIIRIELVACFIFPLVYIYLSSRFNNIEFIGKTIFSGREVLWKSGLELIQKYPIFGSGNDFMYSLGNDTISSSHNFMLGVVKMFGIIPAISLVYIFPLTTVHEDTRNRIYQFVMIGALLIGFTEASFIESHTSIFLMLLFLQSYSNNPLGDVFNEKN